MEYSPVLSPWFCKHPVTETVLPLSLSLSAAAAFWHKPRATTRPHILGSITDFIHCLLSGNRGASSPDSKEQYWFHCRRYSEILMSVKLSYKHGNSGFVVGRGPPERPFPRVLNFR